MFENNDITCCAIFKDLLDNAGKKGLGIIVADYGETCFRLQSRAIAHDQWDLVYLSSENPEVVVNLSQSVTIRYCPFCGKNLSKILKRQHSHYQTLVERHAKMDDRVF